MCLGCMERWLTGVERSSLKLAPHVRPMLISSDFIRVEITEKLSLRSIKKVHVEVTRIIAFNLPVGAGTSWWTDVFARPRPVGRLSFVSYPKRSVSPPSLRS